MYELFFSQYISFSFDGNAASIYGQILFNMEAKGTPIGAYDLQIAAIVIAHNLILVIHNIKEFERI